MQAVPIDPTLPPDEFAAKVFELMGHIAGTELQDTKDEAEIIAG